MDKHFEEIMANEPDPIQDIDREIQEELRNSRNFRIGLGVSQVRSKRLTQLEVLEGRFGLRGVHCKKVDVELI